MKIREFNSFVRNNVSAIFALIGFVLLALVNGNADAQTDEEKVAVLITIINQHMAKTAYHDGVCLYPEVDFRGGDKFCFTESLPSLPTAWSSRVSSISVSPAYHIGIYLESNYGGASRLLEGNTAALDTFENLVKSIKLTPKDRDQDGVIYSADQCPDTVLGETVNANGCATNQLDTDLDGVNDRDDQCPASAAGYEVDVVGCTIDTDADGVDDSLDQCPNTSGAANGIGCAPSQLDSDGDGVNDAIDLCPNTNGPANSNGCSPSQIDSDNDGVNDATDQCPNTSGTANGVGCATSQLDTDNDGVNDDVDQCPGTTSNLIGQDGCAVPETDSDSDGIPDVFDNTPTQCVDVDAFNIP